MPNFHHDRVTIAGNSSVDGTGDDRHVLVDALGHLQVDVLSGGGAAALRARQNIAVDSDTFLHCDAAGNLQVDVASAPETAITHAALTELGGAINASSQLQVEIAAGGFGGAVSHVGLTALNTSIGTDGNAGPANAVSVAGTDGSGNLQELAVDTDGRLETKLKDPTVTTLALSPGTVAAAGSTGSNSAALQIKGRPDTITFLVSNSTAGYTGDKFDIYVQVSDNGSSDWFTLSSGQHYNQSSVYGIDGTNQTHKIATVKDLLWPYMRVHVKQTNSAAASATYTVKACQ